MAAGHARTVLLLAPEGPMGHVGPALQQQLCLTALRSLHTDHHHHHRHHQSPSGSGEQHKARHRQRVVVESAGAVASSAAIGVESDLGDPLQVRGVRGRSGGW